MTRSETLPSGVVTFAFTDIEGSTQRWERNRSAMDEALRRHDAILHDAIATYGGVVFKTVGDAFCAAFARPSDAVAALVDAQRRLAAEDFSAVDGLRIRAAIHTGNAEERAGDYFGPPVNRVARLLGVAHGGQVVLSGTARALAEPSLPDGVALRDLGRHRLKDLIEPESVYQLLAPGLGEDFPALRSLEALRHNLPQQMTAMIGRDREVAEIGELLASNRLVTVVGAGGIGKTRTTLQAGANLLDAMSDGVWFVELAPLTSADYLPATIAQTMSLHLGSDGEPLDALVRALKAKHACLIFDNCEHLIDGVARTLGALLRGCSELSILASSRQALGIAGEATYRMPSLAAPPAATKLAASDATAWPAVALFVERATAADRRFELTDENATTVADICRRLDGIPLAIELAAARVKILSPKQLSDRLDERFRVLTGGSRDAMPRQQTLHALIDWSHDLLDDRERALFRRLGIFVNGFTLDGAIAVGASDDLDEIDIIDLLQSLVDKSLVATEPDGDTLRYRLLESTRAYAREKLTAADEHIVTANRHAASFAAMAAQAYREFDSKMPPNWLATYSAEIEDLRAALTFTLLGPGEGSVGARMASDCGPIFLRMELLAEGLRWCDAARARGHSDPNTRGRLDYVASMMHNNLGESRLALFRAESAVQHYGDSDDERGSIRALSQVARLYSSHGRLEESRLLAAEALRRARALDEPRVLCSVLRRYASSLPIEDIEQARSCFSEALAFARSVGDTDELSLILEWWAAHEAAAGAFERSIQLGLEALDYISEASQINLELHIAEWCIAAGRVSEARPHADHALELSQRVGNPLLRAYAILYSALCNRQLQHEVIARLYGYASNRLTELESGSFRENNVALSVIERTMASYFSESTLSQLTNEGARWNEADVLSALRGLS